MGPEPAADLERIPVLVIEDQPELHLLYRSYLKGSRFRSVSAASLREARLELSRSNAQAIVLDIMLRGEDAWKWLAQIKASPPPRLSRSS